MTRLPKYWFLSIACLLSFSCLAQKSDVHLAAAETALREGRFSDVLTSLVDAPHENLRYHYLAGLALEGVDSLVAAEAHWVAYLGLTEGKQADQAYHQRLGHFCLANNYLLRGAWQAAEQSLKLSLEPIAVALPDTLSAKIWNSYGVLKIQQNKQMEALTAFRKAVGFWESAGSPERALLPRFYAARLQLWRYPEAAVNEFNELLRLPVAPLDDLHPAVPALSLSEVHLRQGRVGQARTAFEEAEKRIDLYQGIRKFTELVYFQSIKGLLHLREGRDDLAVAAFSRMDTANRAEMVLPPDEELYFRGLTLQYSGRLKQAIELYEKALDKVNPDNLSLGATIYQHIGECHLRQNSFVLSQDYLQRANELWRSEAVSNAVQTELLMAEAFLGNRDTIGARRILNHTRNYCLSAKDSQGNFEVCLNLVGVYLKTEDTDLALPVLEVLRTKETALSGLSRARWLAGLAHVRWENGDTASASQLSQQSIDALLDHWSGLRGMEGLRLQRNYFDRIFRLGITCALAEDDLNRAIRIAEAARGLDLKGELVGDFPKQLNHTNAADKEEYLKGIAANLSPQQVVIYYLKSLDSLHAVVIKNQGAAAVINIGKADELDRKVGTYLSFLADSVTDLDLKRTVAAGIYARVCSLSYELYQQLVLPFALTEGAELVIVPDGNLHFLSFASLLQEMPASPTIFQDHDYLLRRHAIAYLPTVALLVPQEQEKSIRYHSISAFAPDYSPESGLSALLNNQEEVARLEATFDGEYHYGQAAQRTQLPTAKIAADRLLHLSMHAVFDPNLPDSSWLAFAGAEIQGPSAWYFSREIENNFNAHPFVFLSACQTANGKFYRGEGVLSITRALMARGNNHIVSSLWNVDDERVGRLINAFYESLEKEGSSVQALRTAQLEYLKKANAKTAYPYYWAGFMHYGISTKVAPKPKSDYWYLLALSALVLVLASFWQRYGN